MSDVVLSPQTIALVGGLMAALSSAVAYLYRQALKDRDRLLDERERLLAERDRVLSERDARLVDLWRDLEEKEIRVTTLEAGNERLQKLASDATEGWKLSVYEQAQGRARPA